MERQVLGVLLVALAVGCGDGGSDGTGGAAGTGNTAGSPTNGGQTTGGAGSAGASTAGSTTGGAGSSSAGKSSTAGSSGMAGASGDARLAAASLNILAPAGCSVTAHYEEMPLVAAGHAVTATEKNKTIVDGTNDTDGARAKVACGWMGTAAPYTFTAALTFTGQNSRLVSLEGKATAGQMSDITGVFTLPGGKQYMGMCTVTTIAVDEAKHSIWGSLHCDSIKGPGGQDTCGVGESYFYFENCDAP